MASTAPGMSAVNPGKFARALSRGTRAGPAACALAPTLGALVLLRLIQAAGAAMLQSKGVALVTTSAPKDRMRFALGVQAGLGLGIFVPANNTIIMRSTAGSSASLLGGLINMARGIGTAFGICLMALALELLSCMADHPGIRPSQLARMLRLAPSSVATLISGLQSAGYAVRTRGGSGADGTGDRRTASLDLSGAGAAAVGRWHRVNAEIITAAVPQDDQDALRDAAPALRDLTASIDAQAD